MPNFDITLNLYVLGLLLIMAVLAGYLPRSHQILRKNRKILKLEEEMVQTHAELLDIQRENCDLEARMKDFTNPVIAMNSKNPDDQSQTPLTGREALRPQRPTGTR
ncbi:MAG TPA: hypothetical protein VNU72_09360 [Puia sp.]|nr:hypothetical protein [Puia sp.]